MLALAMSLFGSGGLASVNAATTVDC